MSSGTGSSQESDIRTQSYLPRNAVDTHVHIFDPKLGPYAAERAYTPEDAPLKKLIAFNKSLSADSHNTKLVLVQPSPYKYDCSVMMQCLRMMRDRDIGAFGIAVVDLDTTTDGQLRDMHALGVRGIRLNFQADGKEVSTDKLVATLRQTAERIRYLPGWVIQLFVPGWIWDYLHEVILHLPVKVIADHFGGMLGPTKLPSNLKSTPTSQPGFNSLLSLARNSRVYVKISGLYRMSTDVSSNFEDLQPLAQKFAQEIPDQMIWGSDWPHTGEGHDRVNASLEVKEPFRVVDNLAILERLYQWMGNDVYARMLVKNPSLLYLD
ncbi:transcriptional family amidohydrolase family protein [Penicillium brasilianum]|uniref:Transcriptional family amidohydrolase family protein n=1 Tax=Penicillium brasilianum TaxID=104259 RepID=A0A1S9RE04_PENBI|nr:transcriptional family amidohydrolase family protein [Penicillium brasilianum]